MLPIYLAVTACLLAFGSPSPSAQAAPVAQTSGADCDDLVRAEYADLRAMVAARFPAADLPVAAIVVDATPGGLPIAPATIADGRRGLVVNRISVCDPGAYARRDIVRYLLTHELAHAIHGRDEIMAYKLGAALAVRSGVSPTVMAKVAGTFENMVYATDQADQTGRLVDYPEGKAIAAAIRLGAGL